MGPETHEECACTTNAQQSGSLRSACSTARSLHNMHALKFQPHPRSLVGSRDPCPPLQRKVASKTQFKSTMWSTGAKINRVSWVTIAGGTWYTQQALWCNSVGLGLFLSVRFYKIQLHPQMSRGLVRSSSQLSYLCARTSTFEHNGQTQPCRNAIELNCLCCCMCNLTCAIAHCHFLCISVICKIAVHCCQGCKLSRGSIGLSII
jgi:hypothetical protein